MPYTDINGSGEVSADELVLGPIGADEDPPLPGSEAPRTRSTVFRVGDHRVMYDVIVEDRTILVLGVVHRSDLERWLRSR